MSRYIAAALAMLIAVMTFAAIGTEKAYACSCMMFESFEEALDVSSHVLDATAVHKKEERNNRTIVSLAVTAAWKGEAKTTMNVVTASSSASCGYSFDIGKRYAVFANEDAGELHVSLCSATTFIADDSPIFDELGQPEEIVYSRVDEDGGSDPNLSEIEAKQKQDPYDPENLRNSQSQAELTFKLENRKSAMLQIFFIIGGVLIIGAAALFISRFSRRKR